MESFLATNVSYVDKNFKLSAFKIYGAPRYLYYRPTNGKLSFHFWTKLYLSSVIIWLKNCLRMTIYNLRSLISFPSQETLSLKRKLELRDNDLNTEDSSAQNAFILFSSGRKLLRNLNSNLEDSFIYHVLGLQTFYD